MKKIKVKDVELTDLPDSYWGIVCDFLPNYSSRQDVAESDSLTKFLGNEFDYQDPDDLKDIVSISSQYPHPELSSALMDRKLFAEAMEDALLLIQQDIARLMNIKDV